MTSAEIRKRFLEYFEERGHKVVPSSSLVSDDPSVLLTTAGMQQFKPYFTGEKNAERDFGNKNVVSIQKCFRTSDIDEVGDESHLTFFEMMGNFSFGDTDIEKFENKTKRETIEAAYEFITSPDWMGLEISYVTVFDGSKLPKGDWRKGVLTIDYPTENIWREIFRKSGLSKGDIDKKIRLEGADVFWGPTGDEGPCGPTTEIYCRNADGKDVEIWNIVFNRFYCNKNKVLEEPKMYGIDTGMGLERLAMVVQNKKNVFETDLFEAIIKELPSTLPMKERFIIADHIRGIVFLIADGIEPSNKEQGYILRRLIRRAVLHIKKNREVQKFEDGQSSNPLISLDDMASFVIGEYGNILQYKYLLDKKQQILRIIKDESVKFSKTFYEGLKQFKDFVLRREPKGRRRGIGVAWDQGILYGDDAFYLYQSFGFPREVMKDLCREQGITFDDNGFERELAKHQQISRAGVEKKFGGHGLTAEAEGDAVKLHTATHLLHQALRDVLGESVRQEGSDITTERARFDFRFERKLTDDEKKQVEAIVNEKIRADLPVNHVELPKEEAEKTGALHYFKEKYPDTVSVYYIGNSLEDAYSKEFCGGPHVTHTGEIEKFKIVKEESVSAGVRRIRAVVE